MGKNVYEIPSPVRGSEGSSVIDTCDFSESDYGECDWMDTYDSPTVGKSLCLVLLKQHD